MTLTSGRRWLQILQARTVFAPMLSLPRRMEPSR